MVKVIKRDCTEVDFNVEKIEKAIIKSMRNGSGRVDKKLAKDISNIILSECKGNDEISIYDIEKMVFDKLCLMGHQDTARAYEQYRTIREYQRQENTIDGKVLGLIDGTNKETLDENSNKQQALISTQRDLIAEEVSKDICLRLKIPAHLAYAHNIGRIHMHDLGHYLNPSFNCELINLEDMLQNGTVINGKMIEKPKSFQVACTVATQIIAQVASGQFGGQTISLAHLVPFVDISRQRIREDLKESWDKFGFQYTDDALENETERLVKKEVSAGVQTFNYQINTLQTSNGQSPFLSLFMWVNEVMEYQKDMALLIEEVFKQRLVGFKNEVGVWISPAFPKLLYALDYNNTDESHEFWYLSKLAAKCMAKRMMPDCLSVKILRENYEGNVVPPMGCRAFLSPWKDENGNYKLYGRFNMGVTSINLADCGLTAKGDINKFWEILDDTLQLCYEASIHRYEKLKNVTSDVSPIHWQYGAIARLPKHAHIGHLLEGGYATITLGYLGLYECVMALIGQSHTTKEGEKLALQIMNHLKETTVKWKQETNLGFALYGTPSESLTEKFAKACRNRHGVIEGITDKDYLTNSYHVNVTEPIDAFSKLNFESQFHAISSGGAISYVEVPNLTNNTIVIEQIIKYIYDHVQYAELNTKSDCCHVCGFDGEMLIDDDLEWYCPQCGNRDKSKMNVVRRTCGYLGENFWGKGRTQEIKERVLHL